jgi:hypothetical protein
MDTETAFWSGEAEDDDFDPVTYPEIKPYIAPPLRDDELGLRKLLEWPEALAGAAEPRRRRRPHGGRTRTLRRARS